MTGKKQPGTERADEGLDREAILARVAGDVELLREVVELFREECQKWMAEIRDAIGRGDAAALRFTAHLLRGSAGHFGRSGAYEAAHRLELMAGAGDLTRAADTYSVLEATLAQLQPALARLVPEPAPRKPSGPAEGVELQPASGVGPNERQP